MTDWTEVRPTLELVKQTVTMVEVAELLGLEPDSNDKIRPPWNENERTPSCQLYEDHFYDYATGRWGDFVDLVQEFDEDATHGQIVWQVWNRALKAGREPGDVERQPVRHLKDFTAEIQKNSFDPEFGWAGVRRDGQTQLVPHAEPGIVYGVKTRGPAGKAALPGSQFGHRLYDPLGWSSTQTHERVILCEGESDCWAMSLALPGERVLALPSGAATWKDRWLEDLHHQTVHICMDNDKAGKNALDKITRKVGWARAKELRVPPLFNDAREAINAGWKPSL